MYLPPKFALTPAELAEALSRAEFAQLVSSTPAGLVVTPLPMFYDADGHALLGHVARANPHWHADGATSVAVFTGPQAYISPGYYATKTETGKVVPTWNYEVLNAYGRLRIHDDADWVLGQVTRLTDRHEHDRPQPWQVGDAPRSYIRAQLAGVVGIELPIDRVEAKAKMSQNQPQRNRAGVVGGLRASSSAMDHLVAERVARFDPDRSPSG